ncbi:Zinc finger, BED-type predicted [Cynara cardunculus var. scolymus]|uniref:Zinc finger, BED-type predicted n=1 Tax=Cynara cardunculus var. scolymus TaxID=59895 RepID=A0A103XS21_CYNCS|nr:Zinc finger, BED-type predicted [Cynara cardunculus var. scolymus]
MRFKFLCAIATSSLSLSGRNWVYSSGSVISTFANWENISKYLSRLASKHVDMAWQQSLDSMEISDEAVLVDCSRLKSAVWKDFDRVKRGDACVAVCKHCKKKLSGSSTSGTSHLRNHLIRCRRRSNHDVSQMLTSKGKKKEGSLVPVNFTFDHDQGKADIPNLVTDSKASSSSSTLAICYDA